MSSWYSGAELTRRTAWFHAGSALTNMSGGLIAYGVLENIGTFRRIEDWVRSTTNPRVQVKHLLHRSSRPEGGSVRWVCRSFSGCSSTIKRLSRVVSEEKTWYLPKWERARSAT